MSQSDVTPQIAPPRLHFRVPPEPSHLLRARERLRDYLRQYCTDRQVVDDVVLCVEEAATNAIRHSGSDEEIEIAVQFDPGRLVALVKDRGRGFDVDTFDPSVTPDPLEDHGRGLFIIAKLMDSLELSLDGGLEVHMVRQAEPACAPVPPYFDLSDPHRGSGARSLALLEEIDEGFIALDWEYRYVHANQAALHLTGNSLEELLGHTPWEVFPELQAAPLRALYRQAMELGKPSVTEHRSIFDNSWREMRIYPTIAGVSTYFNDITKRKRAEEQLRRQAELLELSFEPILVWRLGGVIESWNRGAEQLYGYNAGEALGQAPRELLRTTFPQPWATIEAALHKHGSWQGELVHRAKDGREVVVLSRLQLVVGSDGIERVLESNRDISERKQAEEALREREQLLRTATHAARLGIQDYDVSSGTVRWDERVREIWGVGPDESVTYETFLSGLHPDDREATLAAVDAATDPASEGPHEANYRVTSRADGRERWVSATWHVSFENGQAVRMVGVVRDITDAKAAEDALRQSEEKFRTLFENDERGLRHR